MGNNAVTVTVMGGLGEIGKNMLIFEYQNEMMLIDSGLAFPDDEMLGVDIVIPDIYYLEDQKDKIKGIVLTHGHEDHIGAIPYVLQHIDAPVYGTRLALGLVKGKLDEHNLRLPDGSRVMNAGDQVEIGPFTVESFRVNHSIADATGLVINTPVGVIAHSGDFKFDQTPVDGQVADFHRLVRLRDENVLALFCDSTNADRPGYTGSETEVGAKLDELFDKASGRIMVATFASNVHRLQQVMTLANKHGRKLAVTGRSMINTIDVASELDYLDIPPDTMIDLREADQLPPEKVVLLTTGSQGEPLAALTRIAHDEHRDVTLIPGDLVIIAASPIPGNEKLVYRTIDNLYRRGAKVIVGTDSGVHVSGHASREEIKLMINFVQPDYLIPFHGEFRHQVQMRELAGSMGMPEDHVIVGETGDILEFGEDGVRIKGEMDADEVLVDGLGVGDVGSVVLHDRHRLSENGILIVVITIDGKTGQILSGPDIITRGFVYVNESEDLLENARQRVARALKSLEDEGVTDWGQLKSTMRDAIGRFLYQETRRKPMIMPIIMDVKHSQSPVGSS